MNLLVHNLTCGLGLEVRPNFLEVDLSEDVDKWSGVEQNAQCKKGN